MTEYLPYLTALSLMRTGDFLNWQGVGIVPELIMVFSKDSHSSLVVRMDDSFPHYPNDRVYLVEAIGDGMQLQRRNARVRFLKEWKRGARCFWYPCRMTETQRRRCGEYALYREALGDKYDLSTLIGYPVGHHPYNLDKWICSEWVIGAHIACGFYINELSYAPDPDDLPKLLMGVVGDPVELIGPKDNELEIRHV